MTGTNDSNLVLARLAAPASIDRRAPQRKAGRASRQSVVDLQRPMDLAHLNRLSDFEWEVPMTGAMRVPGIIYASEDLVRDMDEKAREQVVNVATLPGIVRASYTMPDAHWELEVWSCLLRQEARPDPRIGPPHRDPRIAPESWPASSGEH
jgi:hypothetical protein